jgi:hypothetical protein
MKPAPTNPTIPAEHVVVIAAAVAAACGPRARATWITPLDERDTRASWLSDGRSRVMSMHAPRRNAVDRALGSALDRSLP